MAMFDQLVDPDVHAHTAYTAEDPDVPSAVL